VSGVVNLLLNLLFVVGFDMGVAGVAWGTFAANALSCLLVLRCLMRENDCRHLELSQLRMDGEILGQVLRIGTPASLQAVLMAMSAVVVQSGINSFGDVTVAAWTSYVKTDALTWMISGAFGVSITTFVGQNFGAQKYHRIRKGVWVCMGMSVALVGTLSALVICFRHFILGIYTADPQVIALGAYVMLWTVPFNFVFMPVEVFAGTMRGTGYSLIPTVITCVCVCLFRVTWIFTMVARFHMVEMLALCYPISWTLCAVVFYVVYRRGNWLTKRIEACGLELETA
jgi:putative MATE family efflux protein